MDNKSQVFQTNNSRRWESFKWTLRVFIILFAFLLIVLVVALINGASPSVPSLESTAYESKIDRLTTSSDINKRYKGFKSFLYKKIKEDSLRNLKKTEQDSGNKSPYIRAAFYTPWTGRTSLPDLKKNGDKLNTVFPEWFFIDSIKHTLITRIDSAGLAMMRSKNLRILPILSNYNSHKGKFDKNLLHAILFDPTKRTAFLKQLTDTLSHYKLQGINLDLEDLDKKSIAQLLLFEKPLYQSLHAMNMTVTMDVDIMDADYDYSKLAQTNDYLVLMAYDEYTKLTEPGPISSQKWIEASLDWLAGKISPDKIILGFAGYGHDWFKTDDGRDTAIDYTYEQAINKAKQVNAVIDYDNSNYNLHYSYIELNTDEETHHVQRIKHEVWFTDAATNFNVLRFSDEYATAGTSLWRLGGEDSRLWTYYSRDLSNDALQSDPFNFSSLATIPILDDDVSYAGESGGEVLSIVSVPETGKINLEIDSTELLISEQHYTQLPSGYIIQQFGADSIASGPGHRLVLTFDDGPDPEWTPKILDILEKDKVPASFFVVGLQVEKNIPLLQRINRDGFEIGNHTFTHSNMATMSPQRADLEMKLTRLLIESITGRSTILFRAPYNADSEPQTYEELEPIVRSRKANYLTIGESIDPRDWEPNVTADSIVARVISQVEDRSASMILLHDAGGETRQATVEALPRIIDYFKKKGYKFTTIANMMGKTKNDVMPLLPPDENSSFIKFNFFLAEATYWGSHIIFALFIVGIILSIGRMVLMAILASAQKRKAEKILAVLPAGLMPEVTIIVPAYNEEVNAVRTINSLLQQDYPNLQIAFVDDGSKDATFATVYEAFKDIHNVHVYTKENGGKASALNVGIEKAFTEFVVCIDADTQLKEDAVSRLMEKFIDGKVGAVAGNVKVGNEVNMITYWQSIEYITSQNFDRRAFDLLDCITVVPGAIGAFRKEAIQKSGGFTTDTLAEDCDLTMRLHRNGYSVRNCSTAVSYTEAPETMQQFMKQRFRWSFGVIQCFWKHRDAVLNPKYKNFGMIALPNILIFQMILPVLAPLADLLLVFSLVAAGFGIIPASIPHILLYYGIFTVVDVAGAALAFAFEKEDYKKLIWLLPQRLIYRQLMYYILLKSFNRAIKGELQGWGALKRTGNVKQVSPA
jgi:cellulose synthase/poly-beta-1,6-N-acetylglucosamine synthase-like glycosyltransferase/spore germination protein YaaH/peptidoglycan/xylan/chitin deacetylase (PgdA/CDA1 family)